jgi:hypothetical protein
MGAESNPDTHYRCGACGQRARELARVPAKPGRYEKGFRRVIYLCCEHCAQIKIVEEQGAGIA